MPVTHGDEIRELRVRVRGVDFVGITKGSGPLVLLVHGFPDIPQSWSAQIDALSAAGYQVVAPYLPGYLPTSSGRADYFDKASLANYFSTLIEGLSPEKKIHYVGQDWGAIIGYALCAARPDLLSSAVLMAVPHPEVVSKHLLAPKHIHRSFHWWFFQQKDLPEKALLADDMHFIDYLWQYWTVPGFHDAEHIRQVKDCLRQPGVLANALAYYRAMFNETLADPALKTLRSKLTDKIVTPTLALCGADDMRAELMREQSGYFGGSYQYLEVPNAGHFLQREQSQRVNDILIDWLGRGLA